MGWRELWRSDDPADARAVATAIEAMEYAARLRTADGRLVGAEDERIVAPVVVEVRDEHWPELIEVIDEIAREQADFDRFLDAWHQHSGRRKRRFLLLLILIVAALALIGAIEL